MLIAVCCDRGAPGSTTSSLALGVSTPEPTIVVEADPFGGDLALRCVAPGGHGGGGVGEALHLVGPLPLGELGGGVGAQIRRGAGADHGGVLDSGHDGHPVQDGAGRAR